MILAEVLTYMATIADALRSKLIEAFALPEIEGRPPLRPLYVAGELFDWVDGDERLHRPNGGKGGRTRFELLTQTFCDFRCAARPLVGDLDRIRPTNNGIWSLHSPCVRVFGWVPAPHRFVAVYAAHVEDCHGPASVVDEMRGKVLAFAGRHGLRDTIHLGDKLALFPQPAV